MSVLDFESNDVWDLKLNDVIDQVQSLDTNIPLGAAKKNTSFSCISDTV